MSTAQLIPIALRTLTRDGWLLFVTRFARLFAYGSLSVILVFYLVGLGLTEVQSGLVLTLTLAGDVLVSLFADDPGRPDRAPADAHQPRWSQWLPPVWRLRPRTNSSS
jgi:hypothetical protein